MTIRPILLLAATLALAGCAAMTARASGDSGFFDRLERLCGQAFEGRIVSPPVEADAAFAGRRLVMHVRSCSAGAIRIPFHVGDDRSRTWVITRPGGRLRLKHDHRHQDGSEDALSQYGGDSLGEAAAARQEFPADEFSRDLFVGRNIPQSAINVWAMEIEPGRMFAYELRRPGRFFRVEFDLARPVPAPPPPWGS
ncbi:MAG: hypothetical protein ACT4OE_11300 [Sphingosinicella sp.]